MHNAHIELRAQPRLTCGYMNRVLRRLGEGFIENNTITGVPQYNAHRLLTRVDDNIRCVAPSSNTANSITVWTFGTGSGGTEYIG